MCVRMLLHAYSHNTHAHNSVLSIGTVILYVIGHKSNRHIHTYTPFQFKLKPLQGQIPSPFKLEGVFHRRRRLSCLQLIAHLSFSGRCMSVKKLNVHYIHTYRGCLCQVDVMAAVIPGALL